MAEPVRHVRFDAVFNFRDLGGYRGRDGRTVRWRTLFRSDGLHRLLPEEGERFRELGIRTVLDLRTPEEVADRGRIPETIADVEYHHLAMFDVEPDWPPDDDDPGYLSDRYIEMLETGRRAVGSALAVLARADAYPLVFHCAAGKDRTGILAAVVLSLLGVDDDVIAEDYALSQSAMETMRSWVRANMAEVADRQISIPPSVFGATVETMHRFLEHVRRQFGDVEGFARDLGVSAETIARVQEQLLTAE